MRSLQAMGLLVVFSLSFVLLLAGNGFTYQKVEKMSIEELNAVIDNPDVVVIDVRTKLDWTSSGLKIKGSVREDPMDVDTWAPKYSKDKTLVIYCA